jgi:pyruvate kinase
VVACVPVFCRYIKIISKVENQEGIQNFDEILEKTGWCVGWGQLNVGAGGK